MDTLRDVWAVPCTGDCTDIPQQSQQNHHVLSLRDWKRGILRCRNHLGHRIEGQPRFLQVHLPHHSVPQTNELFLTATRKMRRGKVYPMWEMLKGLPNGSGGQQQFTQAEKRHRVHTMPEMQENLPSGSAKINVLVKLLLVARSDAGTARGRTVYYRVTVFGGSSVNERAAATEFHVKA